VSYQFLDVETIPSLDEYDNPINLGSAILPIGFDVVMIRPDAVVDQLSLFVPQAEDGKIILILALDSIWTINLMPPAKSGVTFYVPASGINLMPGQTIKLMFVAPEKRWYILAM
jgi:hypothetical protein